MNMNALTEAIALTLLHSLWQALIVFILSKVVLHAIPSRHSSIRYVVTTVSLVAMTLISLYTFLSCYDHNAIAKVETHSIFFPGALTDMPGELGITSTIQSVIRDHAQWILYLWMAGSLLFLLRLSGGWIYIQRLSKNGHELGNEWSQRIGQLCQKLSINRVVGVMECSLVSSPVVFGFIKPVILIPVGMTTGLTTAQLEAIFLHELIHIRRNDYLINFLQSIIESIYFFNPCVWLLSGMIRREREHCCDDAVLTLGINAKDYVFALAALEENKAQRNDLVLSFSGNKNELLNRIKRLMEKSIKKYSVRDRLVPVLLLVIGFMCASWFTIQRGSDNNTMYDNNVAADTTIKKKKGKEVAPKVENPTPQAHREEDESSKEESFYLNDLDLATEDAFMFPPMPDFEVPPIPDFQLHMIPEFDTFIGIGDSIPPHAGFSSWTDFEREFTQKFKEQFSNFYHQNEKEFENLLEEVRRNTAHPMFDRTAIDAIQAQAMAMRAQELAHLSQLHAQNEMMVSENHLRIMEKNKELEKLNGERMQELQQQMEKLDAKMKVFDQKMKEFQVVLKEELVKDGYLGKSETIDQMHWSPDGEIRINGKKIKPEHRKKYNDLHKKHFRETN